jgi:hypothetical protein
MVGSIGLPVELDDDEVLYGSESFDLLLCLIKIFILIKFLLNYFGECTHFHTNIDDTKTNIKTRTEQRRIMAEVCIDELL